MDEKFRLDRDVFDTRLTDNSTTEERTLIWDNRYILNAFNEIQYAQEEHQFERIREVNKLDSLFPSDKERNAFKLNDELIDVFLIMKSGIPIS